jgi:hypothetical protein
MTAIVTTSRRVTTESTWRPIDRLSAGEAGALVGTRVGLWIVVQLLLVGGIAAAGVVTDAFDSVSGWWMVYGALVELGTLAVLMWLLRRHGIGYRQLLGPPTRPWQVVVGAIGVLGATTPAIFFSSELTAAVYGVGATPPMLAIVDLPAVGAAFSVVVWPLLTELVEPIVYLGLFLPALERITGRAWLAAVVTVAVWAAEHAFFPILLTGTGLDLGFAAYRVVSVVPFLAIWTGLYYAFGRRLLPIMLARWVFNGGTALALALGLM